MGASISRGASLVMVGAEPAAFGLSLSHVFAVLGFPVIGVGGAMIYLGGGVHPDLSGSRRVR